MGVNLKHTVTVYILTVENRRQPAVVFSALAWNQRSYGGNIWSLLPPKKFPRHPEKSVSDHLPASTKLLNIGPGYYLNG